MCGRMTQNVNAKTLVEKYALGPETRAVHLEPQFNGAPGQEFATVRHEDGTRCLATARFGFAPPWVVALYGDGLINARSETVHEKPAFGEAFATKRCVIPVNGWFEWTGPRGAKQPHWIRPQAEDLLSVAGIWSRWQGGDEHVDTFAVLTTDAAPAIAHLHHRQPVLLDDVGVDVWLDPGAAQDHLLATVQEAADGAYEAWPVSREVNDPGHEGAWLIARLAA